MSPDDRHRHSAICLYRDRPEGSEWWCICFSDEELDDDDRQRVGRYRGD